jgi:hypothetical protein
MILPPEAVDWLVAMLDQAVPEPVAARVAGFEAPVVPEAVVKGLRSLAVQGLLVTARSPDGGRRQMLALVGVVEADHPRLARAVTEVLAFSGLEAGALDVVFLGEGDAVLARMAAVALVIPGAVYWWSQRSAAPPAAVPVATAPEVPAVPAPAASEAMPAATAPAASEVMPVASEAAVVKTSVETSVEAELERFCPAIAKAAIRVLCHITPLIILKKKKRRQLRNGRNEDADFCFVFSHSLFTFGCQLTHSTQ